MNSNRNASECDSELRAAAKRTGWKMPVSCLPLFLDKIQEGYRKRGERKLPFKSDRQLVKATVAFDLASRVKMLCYEYDQHSEQVLTDTRNMMTLTLCAAADLFSSCRRYEFLESDELARMLTTMKVDPDWIPDEGLPGVTCLDICMPAGSDLPAIRVLSMESTYNAIRHRLAENQLLEKQERDILLNGHYALPPGARKHWIAMVRKPGDGDDERLLVIPVTSLAKLKELSEASNDADCEPLIRFLYTLLAYRKACPECFRRGLPRGLDKVAEQHMPVCNVVSLPDHIKGVTGATRAAHLVGSFLRLYPLKEDGTRKEGLVFVRPHLRGGRAETMETPPMTECKEATA